MMIINITSASNLLSFSLKALFRNCSSDNVELRTSTKYTPGKFINLLYTCSQHNLLNG